MENHTNFFFVSSTLISNSRLKLAKNQAKAEQHPETEFLLCEITFFHPRYHSKIKGDFLKNMEKTTVSVLMRLYDSLK